VTANQPRTSETTGRVVMFRPRTSPRREDGRPSPPNGSGPDDTVVADLAKYEHRNSADDYRHRMITNVIALVFIIMLTAAGIWLADAISALRKSEDCLLSGRRNCAPIDVPAHGR
jgi:hypothetical protein